MHRSSSALRWLLAVSVVEAGLATGWRVPLVHDLSLTLVPVLLHATWRVLRLDRAP